MELFGKFSQYFGECSKIFEKNFGRSRIFEKIFGKSSGMIRNLKKLVFFAVVILTGHTTCILEEPDEKYHTRLMFSHAPTDRPWIFERTTRAVTRTGTEIQKKTPKYIRTSLTAIFCALFVWREHASMSR